MATAALRRKIAFWQGHGLLREDDDAPDTFILVEDYRDEGGGGREAINMDEDEAESAMASSHEQKEEELQVSDRMGRSYR